MTNISNQFFDIEAEAKTQPKNNNGSQARESRAPPPSRDIPSPPPRRTAAPPEASPPDNTGKYCHYFANYGKCNYEERTGEKCKFDHNQAPMCNSGINCSRFKCMFSHPRNSGSPGNGNGNFLEQGKMNPWMNPWSMMSPWMTQPQNQFVNPWNANLRQGNRETHH